jgi:hypothetical protein
MVPISSVMVRTVLTVHPCMMFTIIPIAGI